MRFWILIICGLAASCASRQCNELVELKFPAPECPSIEQCRGSVAQTCVEAQGEPLQILALSGGGQYAAFGAGVLAGWRESDNPRPRFQIVTGVSSGALLATHAFLDTRHADEVLRNVFTTLSRADIYVKRPLRQILFADSLNTTKRLAKLIEKHVSDDVIDAVAAVARSEGRVLLVGTVDLDLGRFRIWNMTDLAVQRLYDKYRKVLLASASVPVLFPPVGIDGQKYVDGGAREQVFVRTVCEGIYEGMTDLQGAGGSVSVRRPTVHVIVNGGVGTAAECVESGIRSIGLRSVETLLDEALVGNLWRIWGTARRYDLRFQAIRIAPEQLRQTSGAFAFDNTEMRDLYQLGLFMGRETDSWSDSPELAREEPGHAHGSSARYSRTSPRGCGS